MRVFSGSPPRTSCHLEGLLLGFADTSSEHFNAYSVETTARRLIGYFNGTQQRHEVRRLYESIAKAFEHLANQSNGMLASVHLQTAVNAYREAGLTEESKRVRILMEEKIRQSYDFMTPLEFEIEVTKEDMEAFLPAVVDGSIETTFARIAAAFLPSRHNLEEKVRKLSEEAPPGA